MKTKLQGFSFTVASVAAVAASFLAITVTQAVPAAAAATSASPAASGGVAHAEFDGLWRTAGRGQRGRDGAPGGGPPGGPVAGPPGGGPPPGGGRGGPPPGGGRGGPPGGGPPPGGPPGGNGCCTEEGWHDVYTTLQPWALDIIAKRDEGQRTGNIIPTNTQECKPDGTPTVIEIPYPFQFLQTRNETLILYEADYQVRHIRMNAKHPASPKLSWYGDSIGQWEGDTLVVDTVGLSKKGQTNWDGVPHSDQLHVVERYRVTAPGAMELTMTLTDPGAFNAPWTIVKHFRKLPDRRLTEYVCAENNRDAAVPTE